MLELDVVSSRAEPAVRDRFGEAVKEDPYRSSEFLLGQFNQAYRSTPIRIAGRDHAITDVARINPNTTEATDFVLRLSTNVGILYAKADVSEDFLFDRESDTIDHVYGSRSRRELAMQELQRRLGLSYTASAIVGEGTNVWLVSEEASGPRVGDKRVQNLVSADPRRYSQELGRMLAFSYLFGVSDGHHLNTHYDGQNLTQRDLESPFSDLIPLRMPIAQVRREGIKPARLFPSGYPGNLLALEDNTTGSGWKRIITQSLEDHLWPLLASIDMVRDPQRSGLRMAIGEGFHDVYTRVQLASKSITHFVEETLRSWEEDDSFHLDMQGSGPFRVNPDYPILYGLLLSSKVQEQNPWRIFNQVWCSLLWKAVEDSRTRVLSEQ